jgi:hypothetical protein
MSNDKAQSSKEIQITNTNYPSPLAGESGGEGVQYHDHPHLNPPPSPGPALLIDRGGEGGG